MQIVDPDRVATLLAPLGEGMPRIVASGNFATPDVLLGVADATLERYRLFMLNAQPGIPCRDGVIYETPFVGAGMRDSGERLRYLPMRLSLVPSLFARSHPPDVVLVHTSMPRNGRVSLGIEVNILPAAIEQARARGARVIAQLNPRMPYTIGDAELDCELIDVAIEAEQTLASPHPRPASAIAAVIAANVAGLVADGATLQIGIGAVPDATLAALAGRHGLGIWSETFSDGVLALERGGALDPARPLVSSFLFGSPELYAWVDTNPRVQMLRTETTNNPSLIARQPQMTSINTALQVDLYAQASATRVHGRVYSGFGGQPDFVVGALHAPGGHAVIALPSWHHKSDSSTIVPVLDGQVTSFQHSALVSEHGSALIFGHSQQSQARLIIEQIADPRVRDELLAQAATLGLAPGRTLVDSAAG